jgi:hypothetical protein
MKKIPLLDSSNRFFLCGNKDLAERFGADVEISYPALYGNLIAVTSSNMALEIDSSGFRSSIIRNVENLTWYQSFSLPACPAPAGKCWSALRLHIPVVDPAERRRVAL